MLSNITIGSNWKARDYQKPLFHYMLRGGSMEKKRACCVWHRRAGKDACSLQLAKIATQQRVGTYWHMLPTLKQGRRVIWDGIDKDGRRMIDVAFPKEMRKATNNSDMKIEFKNGSIWQVVGSDNYDSLVGTNPVGIVFSEFSIADPASFTYLRPILLENDGWAVFIYTPRGKTHGYSLHEIAKKSKRWFAQKLSIDDTGVMTREQYENEIDEGMSREKATQEFLCSFDVGMEGAYYTEELQYAENNGRIGDFPWDPAKSVYTFWDIGFRDNTSVIFAQENTAGNPRIVDHISRRNLGLRDWLRILKEQPYDYEQHFGPHDMDQTEWGTGQTRTEQADVLGVNFEIVDKLPIPDGIDAARAMIRKAEFNKPTCGELLDNLGYYHRQYDDKRQIFKDKPNHDHSSHDADAFRYLSIGWSATGHGRILVPTSGGGYRANIKVKRACGPNRTTSFSRR